MAAEISGTVRDEKGSGAGLETRAEMAWRSGVVAGRPGRVAGSRSRDCGEREREFRMQGPQRPVVPGSGKP